MSPEWIAIACTVVVTGGGLLITWGKFTQKVSDLEAARQEDRDAHQAEVAEMKAGIAAAQAAASEVKALALAVEHLGERFGDKVGHLADVMGLQMGALKSEFEGLRTEVRRRPRQNTRSRGATQ